MDYVSSLPVVPFVPEDSVQSAQRETVESGAHSLFLARSLLSTGECRKLIEAVAGPTPVVPLTPVDREYIASYRQCLRAVFSSPQLAAVLEKRLRPLLERTDLDKVQPFGVGTDGVWSLPKQGFVNFCFRISEYSLGQHFAMHRDNGFVFSDDFRSIFTVVMYLNEDFQGGETEFEVSSERESVKVRPAAGMAAVFNHDLRHQGLPAYSGKKYVLRTDIMFQRIEKLSNLRFLSDPRYAKAEKLYTDSIALQEKGDAKLSTERFVEAMEIHAELSSFRRAKRAAPTPDMTTVLPRDIWVLEIGLKHLTVRECLSLMELNSYFASSFRMSSRFWFERFQERWPDTHPRTVINVCSALGDSVTFYTAFKARLLADKDFQVVWLDLSTNIALTNEGSFSARVGYGAGHLWGVGSGMFNCYVGHHLEINKWKDKFYLVETPNYATKQPPSTGDRSLGRLINSYHEWFGPEVGLGDSFQLTGFNAVAAAMCARHAIALKFGSFPSYFGSEMKEKHGHVPVLLVGSPSAMRSAEFFYEALNKVVPLAPYVKMVSISEVLSHHLECRNALVLFVSECTVGCSVVIDFCEDIDSIVEQRFPLSLIEYPIANLIAGRENLEANVLKKLQEAGVAQFMMSELARARDRTGFDTLIVAGICSEAVLDTVQGLFCSRLSLKLCRPDNDSRSHSAVASFAAAPTMRLLYHPLKVQMMKE